MSCLNLKQNPVFVPYKFSSCFISVQTGVLFREKSELCVLFSFIVIQLPLLGLHRELDFIKLLRDTVTHQIAANSISHGTEEGIRANCRYIVELPHV